MAKIEKKNEYNKSFYNFRALASATAISEMAISLQIYNLLSKLPKNYPKKRLWRTRIRPHTEVFYNFPQKSRKSQKGHAACCTHMYLLTSQKFPFFRLLSVSSVINIYLRNQRDLHDLKSTHIFVSIGACGLRRSCRFSSHTEVFYNFPQKSRKSQKGLRSAPHPSKGGRGKVLPIQPK